MKAYGDDHSILIAKNEADLKVLLHEIHMIGADEEDEADWDELMPFSDLRIRFHKDDPTDFIPKEHERLEKDNGEYIIIAKIGDWVEAHGRGFLCGED